MGVLARRSSSDTRLDRLRSHVEPAQDLIGEAGCIYVTGSYGRGESSGYSDVDVFVALNEDSDDLEARRSELVDRTAEAARRSQMTFSGDETFELVHTVDELVDMIGSPDDDARNTLTARLLLLLESRPLTGEAAHRAAVDRVIAAYCGISRTTVSDSFPPISPMTSSGSGERSASTTRREPAPSPPRRRPSASSRTTSSSTVACSPATPRWPIC